MAETRLGSRERGRRASGETPKNARIKRMTKRLEDVLDWLRTLPYDQQERVADLVIAMCADPYERE